MIDYINLLLEMPASEFELFITVSNLTAIAVICLITELNKVIKNEQEKLNKAFNTFLNRTHSRL